MVAERLAVVAGEDHQRALRLTGLLQGVQHAAHLIVDQLDHRVVGGLQRLRVARERRGVDPGFRVPAGIVRQHRMRDVERASRVAGFALEVHGAQPLLLVQVTRAEQRAGHLLRMEPCAVLRRWIERLVRVIDVDRGQPRRVGAAPLAHEVDGLLRAPGGLVQLRRHARRVLDQLAQIVALGPHPVGIRVAGRPAVAGRVTPPPVAVAVVAARLGPLVGARQVQLADQAAVVAGAGQQPGDQRVASAVARVAVAGVLAGAGVGAGQEAGAAGCADRALAERVRPGSAVAPQAVEPRRAHVRVAAGADRVVALLVGADPQDVGWHGRSRTSAGDGTGTAPAPRASA